MTKRHSQPPVQPAKISRPRLGACFPRKRLFKLIDKAGQRPVVWIAAQAGAGKTTLLSSYLAERELPALWYQLDLRDADPATFFYYLREAVRRIAPRKRETLPLLTPEYLLGLPIFARNFFEELFQRLRAPAVLVLDNYQEVPEGAPLHQLLAEAFSAIPDGTTVVVLSRSEPPAAFARLQAQGLASLVPAEALALRLEEARGIARLLKAAPLPSATLTALHAQTQGWTAGLMLLLERGRRTELNDENLPHVARDALFDYFAAEIFQRTEPAEQELLLKTALLPKINAASAARFTGSARAIELLNGLVRRNYFTSKRPGRSATFEYHPLFRDFLLTRGHRVFDAGTLAGLRAQAAALLEEDGQVEAAADLLSANADMRALAELALRHAPRLISHGRSQTLESWLRALPAQVVADSGWLLYWQGTCRLPFAPGESRHLLEQALTRFRQTNDRAGGLLAWAGIVDSIFHEGLSFAQLDRWIEIFPTLNFSDDLPVAVRDQVTVSLLGSLVMRQPHHRDLGRWTETALALLQSGRDIRLRVGCGIHLAIYAMWSGDTAQSDLVVDLLSALARAAELPPLTTLMIRTTEALHAWLVAADFDRCLGIVDAALALADQTSVHLWDNHLLGHGLAAALSAGKNDIATQLSRRLAAGMIDARPLDIAYYHYLASWHALQRNDLADAAGHIAIVNHVHWGLGLPFGVALVAVVTAHTQVREQKLREARKTLAIAEELGRSCASRMIEFMVSIAYAGLARAEADEEELGRRLARALAVARECGLRNSHCWDPRVMADWCAWALEAGIERDYVKMLIRTRHLAPPAPSWQLPDWPWPVRIRTLGAFVVEVDGIPLKFAHKAQRRPLELLMALIALGGTDIGIHRLANLLWPDAEADAAQASFTSTLHRLRKLLGDDAMVLAQNRLSLNDRRVCVDIWTFERAFQRGAVDATVEQALDLYGGPFLGADTESPWVLSTRERLRAKFVRGVAETAHRNSEAGRHEEAIQLIERGIEADEVAEELYRQLMRAHLALGRRAEALRAYQRCRQALRGLLDVAPDAETEALHRALRPT